MERFGTVKGTFSRFEGWYLICGTRRQLEHFSNLISSAFMSIVCRPLLPNEKNSITGAKVLER
jgi:hypothetical protein